MRGPTTRETRIRGTTWAHRVTGSQMSPVGRHATPGGGLGQDDHRCKGPSPRSQRPPPERHRARRMLLSWSHAACGPAGTWHGPAGRHAVAVRGGGHPVGQARRQPDRRPRGPSRGARVLERRTYVGTLSRAPGCRRRPGGSTRHAAGWNRPAVRGATVTPGGVHRCSIGQGHFLTRTPGRTATRARLRSAVGRLRTGRGRGRTSPSYGRTPSGETIRQFLNPGTADLTPRHQGGRSRGGAPVAQFQFLSATGSETRVVAHLLTRS